MNTAVTARKPTDLPPGIRKYQTGMSLVELMVALLLGLLILAALLNVFLSNARTLNTLDALSRIQEDTRITFEILGNELRQAGSMNCDPMGSKEYAANSDFISQELAASERGWHALQTNLADYLQALGKYLPDANEDQPQSLNIATLGSYQDESGNSHTYPTLLLRAAVGATNHVHIVETDGITLELTEADPTYKADDYLLFCNANQTFIVAAESVNGKKIVLKTPVPISHGLIARYQEAGFHVNADNQLIYWQKDNMEEEARVYLLAAGITAIAEKAADGTPTGNILPGFALRYLHEGDTAYQDTLDSWSNLRAIEITLNLEQPVEGDEPVRRSFSQVVNLRNLQ